MGFETISYRKTPPVAEIVLNRPGVLNALNAAMDEELFRVLLDAGSDDSVRIVVVRGSGRALTAGKRKIQVKNCGLVVDEDGSILEFVEKVYQDSVQREIRGGGGKGSSLRD